MSARGTHVTASKNIYTTCMSFVFRNKNTIFHVSQNGGPSMRINPFESVDVVAKSKKCNLLILH